MEKFAAVEMRLKRNVSQGERATLLALFSANERFKRMEVLADADEGAPVKLAIEGLGEAELRLGDDMEKGQKKTIMTLFWFSEKSKPIEMMRAAEKGETVTVTIWKE